MIRRHPSRARLADWLDGSSPHLDEHLATCERCAETLTEIDTQTSPLRDALEAILRPPLDLAPLVLAGFERRERDREDLGLLTDLFSLPLYLARSLNEDHPPAPDSDGSYA